MRIPIAFCIYIKCNSSHLVRRVPRLHNDYTCCFILNHYLPGKYLWATLLWDSRTRSWAQILQIKGRQLIHIMKAFATSFVGPLSLDVDSENL